MTIFFALFQSRENNGYRLSDRMLLIKDGNDSLEDFYVWANHHRQTIEEETGNPAIIKDFKIYTDKEK